MAAEANMAASSKLAVTFGFGFVTVKDSHRADTTQGMQLHTPNNTHIHSINNDF